MCFSATTVGLTSINFYCSINLLSSFHLICNIYIFVETLLRFSSSVEAFLTSCMLLTSQAKEGESNPLISDSLSAAENGGSATDDEPLKVPMWSSKYSKA